jgi:hypothetical protein
VDTDPSALFDAPNRVCRRCKTPKPAAEFHRRGEGHMRRKLCVQCRAEVDPRSSHRSQNPESKLRERLARYRITPDQYRAILAAQGGKCAMCHTPPTEKRTFHVDHCHESGRVRGVLCNVCNTQLGAYERLRERAAAYLAEYGAGHPLLNYDTEAA